MIRFKRLGFLLLLLLSPVVPSPVCAGLSSQATAKAKMRVRLRFPSSLQRVRHLEMTEDYIVRRGTRVIVFYR